MPVYAGRVPALAVERLKGVKANGAKCVIVAVYGNRAYEDALLEMQDVATEIGFQVIAAVAAIAEHSICRMYGAGRPDDEDAKVLASFGLDIINKVNDTQSFGPLVLPGNRPYKQGCLGPYPTANDGMWSLRERMSYGSDFFRQPQSCQPGILYRLYAMCFCLSNSSKRHW